MQYISVIDVFYGHILEYLFLGFGCSVLMNSRFIKFSLSKVFTGCFYCDLLLIEFDRFVVLFACEINLEDDISTLLAKPTIHTRLIKTSLLIVSKRLRCLLLALMCSVMLTLYSDLCLYLPCCMACSTCLKLWLVICLVSMYISHFSKGSDK